MVLVIDLQQQAYAGGQQDALVAGKRQHLVVIRQRVHGLHPTDITNITIILQNKRCFDFQKQTHFGSGSVSILLSRTLFLDCITDMMNITVINITIIGMQRSAWSGFVTGLISVMPKMMPNLENNKQS